MNKFLISAIFLSLPLKVMASTDSCSDQINALSAKVEMAKIQGNTAEESRLNAAISKIEKYCTDERQLLRANRDVRKHERNIQKAEIEVHKAQSELEEARADGQTDKISKRLHKLEEKKIKLESEKDELKYAQEDASKLK